MINSTVGVSTAALLPNTCFKGQHVLSNQCETVLHSHCSHLRARSTEVVICLTTGKKNEPSSGTRTVPKLQWVYNLSSDVTRVFSVPKFRPSLKSTACECNPTEREIGQLDTRSNSSYKCQKMFSAQLPFT